MKTNNKAPKVETISIYQFLRRIPDENTARLYVENMVWPAGRYCPYCQSLNTVEVKDAKPMPYRCKDCRKHCYLLNDNGKEGRVQSSGIPPIRNHPKDGMDALPQDTGNVDGPH